MVRELRRIWTPHTALEKSCTCERQLSPLSQLLSGSYIPKSGKRYSYFGISGDIVRDYVWQLFVTGLRRLVVTEGYEERSLKWASRTGPQAKVYNGAFTELGGADTMVKKRRRTRGGPSSLGCRVWKRRKTVRRLAGYRVSRVQCSYQDTGPGNGNAGRGQRLRYDGERASKREQARRRKPDLMNSRSGASRWNLSG